VRSRNLIDNVDLTILLPEKQATEDAKADIIKEDNRKSHALVLNYNRKDLPRG
jgi:hypothetical protein